MDKVIEKKGIDRRKLAMLLVVAGVLTVLLFAYFSSTGLVTVRVKSDRLSVSTVVEAPFREYIPISGNVEPVTTVIIDATEGGTVKEIYVEDGMMVDAGDPLLKLSNPQLQLDAINREAQLLDQQNNLRSTLIAMDQKTVTLREELLEVDHDLRQAERIYLQNEKLKSDKLISDNEMNSARDQYNYLKERRSLILRNIKNDSLFRSTQVGQIQGSLQLIQRNLQFLQDNLENLVIRAPISGQLSSFRAELGQTKSQGENIAQVDDTSDFKVRARVGEHYLSRVSVNQNASFELGGKMYNLITKKIFPEVANGEFEADLLFVGETPPSIRRGQSLQIRLALGDETKAVLLKRGGFYQDTGGNWVYVLQDGKAVKRNVKLGRQNPDFYEVLEGLSPGDEVVTSRYDLYNNADQLILE